MKLACSGEATRSTPSPGDRIVQFRARQNTAGAKSSSDKHLAIGEQSRGVFAPCGGEEEGRRRPHPTDWVVQFRGRQNGSAGVTPYHKHLVIGEQSRAVFAPLGGQGSRRRPGPAG